MSSKEQIKPGKGENFSRFWRNVHWGIGALALAGGVVAAPAVAAGLDSVAAFEALHGGAWEAGRRHFKKKRERKGK